MRITLLSILFEIQSLHYWFLSCCSFIILSTYRIASNLAVRCGLILLLVIIILVIGLSLIILERINLPLLCNWSQQIVCFICACIYRFSVVGCWRLISGGCCCCCCYHSKEFWSAVYFFLLLFLLTRVGSFINT